MFKLNEAQAFQACEFHTAKLDDQPRIRVDKGEGMSPVWLNLAQALKKELTLPVRHFLEEYGKEIINT